MKMTIEDIKRIATAHGVQYYVHGRGESISLYTIEDDLGTGGPRIKEHYITQEYATSGTVLAALGY